MEPSHITVTIESGRTVHLEPHKSEHIRPADVAPKHKLVIRKTPREVTSPLAVPGGLNNPPVLTTNPIPGTLKPGLSMDPTSPMVQKRNPLYYIIPLIVVIAIIAGALGGTLGSSSSGSSTNPNSGSLSKPPVFSLIIATDPTCGGAVDCPQFNFTTITNIRCQIANITDKPVSNILLRNWVESNKSTVITIDQNSPYNAGNCTDAGLNLDIGSLPVEAIPITPILANYTVLLDSITDILQSADAIYASGMPITNLLISDEGTSSPVLQVIAPTPSNSPTSSNSPTPSSSLGSIPSGSSTNTPTPSTSPLNSSISISQTTTFFKNSRGNYGLASSPGVMTNFSGKLYIGGGFTTLGDGTTSAKYIAAWDGSTWSTVGSGAANGLGGSVGTLAVYNGKLYIGGGFTTLGDGTTSAKYIAAWDGSTWSTVGSGAANGLGGSVDTLAVYNGKLYVGGGFTTLGDGTTSAKYIAAWDGSTWSSLVSGSNNGLPGAASSLGILNDKLYIGGTFTTLGDGSTSAQNIASWNGSTFSIPAQLTPELSGLSGALSAITIYNGALYFGGSFTGSKDGVFSSKGITAYDGITLNNLPIGSSNGVNGNVNALITFNNKLYVGGTFTSLGDGSSANNIAEWNGANWFTLTVGNSNGVNSSIYALTVFNNKLYIGGTFTSLGDGTVAYKIVAWDGNNFFTLQTGANNGIDTLGSVFTLTVYSNRLYIGGMFGNASGNTVSAQNIVAWDGSIFTNLSCGGSDGVLGGPVTELTVYNGKMYVGGEFITLGDGTAAVSLVTWDGSTFSNVTTQTGSSINGTVQSFGVLQNILYIGGSFTTLSDGTLVNNVVGYDGFSWSNLTIGNATGVSGAVNSLYADGSMFYVGGTFAKLGDGTVVNALAWTGSSVNIPLPSSTPSNTPTPSTTASVQSVVSASNTPSVSFSSTNTGTATPTPSTTVTASTTNTGTSTASGSNSPSRSVTPSNTPSPSVAPQNYWFTNARGNYGLASSPAVMANFSGKLYMGGSFSTLGDGTTAMRYITSWDGTTWSNLPAGGTSNGVGSAVYALAVYNGKLYVGGAFTTLGDYTTSAKFIVAWDGSTWSTLGSGANNGLGASVKALAVYNGKLYVGGGFTTLGDGTTSAKYIAVWDGSTWSTVGSGAANGLGGSVGTLAVYNGKLYVGGTFTTVGGGTSAKYIAAWDGSTWAALGSGAANGLGAFVQTLTVYNSKLYVGGAFTTLGDGTTSVKNIAIWDGSTWSSLVSGSSNGVGTGGVNALQEFNGKLYIGGGFTTLGDGTTSAKNIAIWDGSTWASLVSGSSNGVSGSVVSLCVYNNNLFIGGSFTRLGDLSTSAQNIASWNGSTFSVPAQYSAKYTGVTGGNGISCMVSYNNKIYFGGDFTSTADGSFSINRIAAYDGASITNLPVGNTNGLPSSVNVLAVYNGKLYIGGAYGSLADTTTLAKNIVAWDGTNFSVLGSAGTNNGVEGIVYALTVYNGKLYIGGSFTMLGDGTEATYVAIWDGSFWSTLVNYGITGRTSNSVRAFTVYNGKLYIGGYFSMVGDYTISANNIVAYDGISFTSLSYGASNGVANAAGNGQVYALIVYNEKMYISGTFTSLGDGTTSVTPVISWDGTIFSNVSTVEGTFAKGLVYSFSVLDNILYMGGSFTRLSDGTLVNNVVGYDGFSWSNLTIGNATGVSGAVNSLYADGSMFYVGGTFAKLGDGTVVNALAWTGSSVNIPLPSSTPSNTPTPSITPSNTPTTSVTSSNTPTISQTPTASVTPSNTPVPSSTPLNFWYTNTRGNYGVSTSPQGMASYNGKLYMGGAFTTLGDGTSANRIAAWDGTSWSKVSVGINNGVTSGVVYSFTVFNNILYFSGTFTFLADGTSANRIAAWDGTMWANLTCGSSNGFSAATKPLAVYNGKLYVGGTFTTLGDGTSAKYIAAWDGSTWTSLVSGSSNGVSASVNALTVYNGKLYVGGGFTTLGDGTTSAKYIAAWDGSTWSTLGSGAANGLGVGSVQAINVYNSKLYVGGVFSTTGDGTTSVKNIAIWDGSTWASLVSGSSNGVGTGGVNALQEFNGKLYIGGGFTTLGDGTTSAKYIAAWDGSVWSSLAVGASNGVSTSVNSLCVFNNNLFIGGAFTTLGDGVTPTQYIGIWNGTTFSVPAQTNPRLLGLSNSVSTIISYNGEIYFGGTFTDVKDGTISIKRIAVYNAISATVRNLPVGSSNGIGGTGTVNALAVYNGTLYIGGSFTTLGDGTSAKNIVTWNGTSWATLGSGTNNGVGGAVNALAVYNNKLYIGGSFTMLGDSTTSAKYIVTWNGTSWATLGSGTNNGVGGGAVSAFSVFNDKLYLGGIFTTAGSLSAKSIASWDGTSFTNLPTSTVSDGLLGSSGVSSITVYKGRMYIAGSFTSLGDNTIMTGFVSWDGNTFSIVRSSSGVKLNAGASSLVTVNGKLYIGGSFSKLSDGNPANGIITYDGTSWSNITIGNATGIIGGSVRSLYVDGSVLYMGGTFTTLGDSTAVNYLTWTGI